MTGKARRDHSARGPLARHVVVLAVLVGLAVAAGLQCKMSMAMPMAHGAKPDAAATDFGSSAAMAPSDAPERVMPAGTGQLTAKCAVPGAAGAYADDDSPGPGSLDGILATCVAVLAAVMSAAAALRRGEVRSIVRMVRSARVIGIRAARPRTLSLAELCLLRT
ncbi:MAG: hypothetical protein ACRDP8_19990 [Actinopolymorphaceae bacterium]